jgi:peptide/nickel transport system permease protein
VTGLRPAGIALAAIVAAFAATGPWLVRNAPQEQFSEFVYAPPMRPHIVDDSWAIRRPFVYPLVLQDRLARRYSEDRSRPAALRFFQDDSLVSVDPSGPPWFALGTDALGRDQLARLAWGARLSLGVAIAAALGALAIGTLVGGIAGFRGGAVDEALMRGADFVVALPALYVVLALRAAMPLVLSPWQVFWTMVVVFAAVGWPFPARAVRAVVASERTREYAEAARALGASRTRLLLRHLLPATRGVLAVQTTLMLPAFILAEATLSFVGLGFSEPVSSWGAMLRDAGGGRTVIEAPWLLTPALAIVCSALAVNLLAACASARTLPPTLRSPL